MKNGHYSLSSEVWLYPGTTAVWHFASIPKKQSAEIRARFGMKAHGWGSLPVTVRIGKTIWKSSIFPDKKSETYVLPLKADVRRKEGIMKGDHVKFSIEITPSRTALKR